MAEHEHHVRFAPMMRVRMFAETPAFKRARVPKLIKPYDNDASGIAKLIKNSKSSTASHSPRTRGPYKDYPEAHPSAAQRARYRPPPPPVHAGCRPTLTSRDLNIDPHCRHAHKGSIHSVVRPTTLKVLKTKEAPTETLAALHKRLSAWALHCAIEMQEALLEMEREKDDKVQSVQNGHEDLPTASETAVVNVDAKVDVLHSG